MRSLYILTEKVREAEVIADINVIVNLFSRIVCGSLEHVDFINIAGVRSAIDPRYTNCTESVRNRSLRHQVQ